LLPLPDNGGRLMSRDFRTGWVLTGALAIFLVFAVLPLGQAAASDADLRPGGRAGWVPPARHGGPDRVGAAPREREEGSGWKDDLPMARPGEVTPEKLERWRTMTPEERERIRRRYHRWKELPPEQRERILERRKRWRELPEEQRRALRKRREAYRNALPEERRAIEKFFRQMRQLPPEQRHAMRRNLSEMGGLPAHDRNERLMDWPFYRQLSPAEREAVTRFLFPNPPPGPGSGPPGSPRD
jgi:hypothetical protein